MVIATDGTFEAKPVETGGHRARRGNANGEQDQRVQVVKWQQVYGIHAQVNGRFVLAAVAFMSKATTATYLILLQAISDWIRTNFGKRWQPTLFMSDFEAAIRAAVERFFEGMSYSLCPSW